jgi:uncharacterized protein (TIGR04255 family)
MVWSLPNRPIETFERNMLASMVVQLRFQPILKIPDHIAAFQDKVRARFPGYETMESQELEIGSAGDISVRKQTEHRFLAHGEPTVSALNVSSFTVEYAAHKEREVLFADVDTALRALNDIYAPIIPVRLGLRYVNIIRRDKLHAPFAWSEILTERFSQVPGNLAALDDSAAFLAEITSPHDRGMMTVKYGILSNRLMPGLPNPQPHDKHFRLDVDRYIDGGFGISEVRNLLEAFSVDAFQVFMAAAGPRLLEWMSPRRQPKGKGSDV